MDKATHMRWELLHAQAQNKAYIPFTSDSMMKEVVAYYDRHGSPADRMTAHYLLGSVYRDMGEIPASLQSFQNAVACADTTDRNCDFRQLAKVYVQMGTLFNNQYLPSEAIDCFGNGVHYALLALDTLLALNIQEQSLISYYEMGNYEEVIRRSEYVHQQLIKAGEPSKAARSLSSALLMALNQNDTARAHRYLCYVRDQVNLKDDSIDWPWVIYRAYEGMYAIAKGDVNAAEKWFRLLGDAAGDDTYLMEMVYKGLMNVYQEKHQADSMVKYARLYNVFNDSSNLFSHQEVVEKMQSQYRYERTQRESQENQARVRHRNHVIVAMVVGMLILLGIGYYWYEKQKEKTKHQQLRQIAEYQSLLEAHRQACDDLSLMKSAKDDLGALLSKKEEMIARLSKQVEVYDAIPLQLDEDEQRILMKMIDEFHRLAIKQEKAGYQQLQNLRKGVLSGDPVFVAKLNGMAYKMELREECICTFIRLGFSASEISILLGISPQALSNQKKRLLKRLFGQEGSASDLNNCISKL